ncbi:C1 family peptidase [Rubellicoccus peritrichatus]|uniref:C1 family peptidase n=1 Tax=Rubellicoccus peritrichatus TaxID=3080537 RepID=A0AAQ3L9D9_9BACT|nr:C1 family peptidase [Puniceicoccus sp. CR14]WOO41261.1 C1 family peptidase [Puniceicoccus sp. CR14]
MHVRFLLVLMVMFAFATSLCGAIAEFAELKANGVIYRKVVVTQVTEQAIIIRHSRGIAQVLLKDLKPELQKQFGYDSERVEAYLADREKREQRALKKVTTAQRTPSPSSTPADRVLASFGTHPDYKERVDLRPDFTALKLHTKDQGRRPSCAVFAVVGALEFENAKTADQPEKFSEEYLIWATRESLGIRSEADKDFDPNQDGDLGFSLIEVVQALRSYGILDSASMPNTFGKSMAAIEEPDEKLISDARTRRKVSSYFITGRGNEAKVDNIVHALNENIPVVIGLGWPNSATLRSAPILSKQKPLYGHAVTLVGYKNESGDPSEMLFQFKNSWGTGWGINGHGWITREYLEKNLNSAAFLEVAGES